MTLLDANERSISERIIYAANGYRRALRNTHLGHEECFNELAEVYEECRHADWDGHGAHPVDQSTLAATYQLIESLRPGFPRPSIGADPDGQMTLEWRSSPRRILSVSIDSAEGFLHYAGIFGPDRRRGKLAYFGGEVPPALVQLVLDLHNA